MVFKIIPYKGIKHTSVTKYFFYAQVHWSLAVFYAVDQNFAESHRVAFNLLDAMIAQHGEEGVRRRISILLTIYAPFEKNLEQGLFAPSTEASFMELSQLFAQEFRMAGRLMYALNDHERAKKFLEKSLDYNPSCLMTRYEYSLLLARNAETRHDAIDYLENITQERDSSLHTYAYYKRETKKLPKFMLSLITTEPNNVSLYFLSCLLLAWMACKDGRYNDCKTKLNDLLSHKLIENPDSPADFPRLLILRLHSSLSEKVVKEEDNRKRLATVLELSGQFKFLDGTLINLETGGKISIKTLTESFVSHAGNGRIFSRNSGIDVVELSVLAPNDARADRSWALVYFQNGGYCKLPSHIELTRTYYVVNGSAKVMIDGKIEILTQGQEITIHPDEQHQVNNIGESQFLVLIMKCIPAWTSVDKKFLTLDTDSAVCSADLSVLPLYHKTFTKDSFSASAGSSMRDIESLDTLTFPADLAASYGRTVYKIRGDGNCQFRAIANQLRILGVKKSDESDYSSEDDSHIELRRLAVEHIRNNPRSYEDFIAEMTLASYIASMEKDGAWGDEYTLWALSRVFNISMVVIPSDDTYPITINRRPTRHLPIVLGHVLTTKEDGKKEGWHYESLQASSTMRTLEGHNLQELIGRAACDPFEAGGIAAAAAGLDTTRQYRPATLASTIDTDPVPPSSTPVSATEEIAPKDLWL